MITYEEVKDNLIKQTRTPFTWIVELILLSCEKSYTGDK